MISAREFPLGEMLVWLLIKTSLQKHFDRVFFRIRDERTEEQRILPMIICANHSSWWDGYVAALVKHHLGVEGYLMMEESQLRRYFFFSWMGCFSVDRHHPRAAMQSIQYAAHLLKERPGRMVWLFPQGEIAPNDRRPLVFFRGAARLAKLSAPALLYPLAIRIEYLAEQYPDLFISLGEPLYVNTEDMQIPCSLKHYTKILEDRVTTELDQLRTDVLASDYSTFTLLMHGRTSTNRILDACLFRTPLRKQ
jgi:chlorobactene lauroyltransferase